MIRKISVVENLLTDSFHILNGMPHYITIEEKETINYDQANLEYKIRSLIELARESEVKRIGALIDRASDHYLNLSKMLINFGFEKYASKVEVFRDLQDITPYTAGYEWRSLSDSTISEDEFKRLWEECMSGSDNAPSSLSMDEQLDSVKNELGEEWRKSCNAIYLEDRPFGIAITHIEPGMVDEGRIFYFGLLPEERGKGLSSVIHNQSLNILKQMGATYYIGSTHETNKRMQKVFLNNGCSIRARTESYYKYFED